MLDPFVTHCIPKLYIENEILTYNVFKYKNNLIFLVHFTT